MAEAFGIAAGAIGVASLSIQIAESLQNVKGFYAAVKNAPPQVEELIEEIEIMQDILGDLELGSQSANVASSANMQRCLKVAQRATKSFATYSSELQNRVKKSRFRGGIKFALSRDDITQMLDQLERTKSSLNLAYSLYQQATAEDRHAAIISAVSSNQYLTAEKTVTPTRNASPLTRRSVCIDERLFHILTPEWVSNTIWQFEMRRSITGFKIMLRTYGVVPWYAPVMKACRKGDAFELQRLFDNRLASPFDRSLDGLSLWQVAAMYSCHSSLRLLTQYDAVSDLACESNMTDLVLFHCNAQTDCDREPIHGAGRRLREEMIWLQQFYSDSRETACNGQHWSTFYSRAMRLLLCSPEEADMIWFWQCLEAPRIRKETVPSRKTIENMLERYVPAEHGGRTPLQLVAVAIACMLTWKPDSIQCLEEIAAVIVTAGTGIHDGDDHHTPLLLFLSTFPAWGDHDASRSRNIQRGLVEWLKILQKAGVDLVAYGIEESRQFLAYRSLENPIPPFLHWQKIQPGNFSDEIFHFNISYGPEPEDWTVQLDHMFDQYVGDFWRMPGLLDENVRAVPGAWIDDNYFA